MKIRSHRSRSVLYILARFEAYKVCEFLATGRCMTERLSKSDVRKHAFYLLVQPSKMAELYRGGEWIAYVYPAGVDGWQDSNFNFKRLEELFPLPKTAEAST